MLKLSGAARTYPGPAGPVEALHPLDLTLEDGEFVTVVGPSGSGKTTLLNLLAGLDGPTAGQLLVDGQPVTDLEAWRRSGVAVIFQALNLLPHLTVRENLELIRELGQTGGEPAQVLVEVGLADRADHFPRQLSGGEQQRVAIARALLRQVPWLLADEPTGNLDLATGRSVLALLVRAHEAGRGVVMVTHNQQIARLGTRRLTLSDGRVRADEVVSDRLRPEELEW